MSFLSRASLLFALVCLASFVLPTSGYCGYTSCRSCTSASSLCSWCDDAQYCTTNGASCSGSYSYYTSDCPNSSASAGAIAGAVIGSIAFCACIIVAIWCCRRRYYYVRPPVVVVSQPQPQLVIAQAGSPVYMAGGPPMMYAQAGPVYASQPQYVQQQPQYAQQPQQQQQFQGQPQQFPQQQYNQQPRRSRDARACAPQHEAQHSPCLSACRLTDHSPARWFHPWPWSSRRS